MLNWESEAERLKVSQVARSPKGFLTYYKQMKGKLIEFVEDANSLRKAEAKKWISKRNGFIARHLAQFNKNPTYRRYLALIMWAYEPSITNEKLKEIMNK